MNRQSQGWLVFWAARRKVFFSEEKKQKSFVSLSRFYTAAYTQVIKVFWFFFRKRTASYTAGAFRIIPCRLHSPISFPS